jgi:hypothetical protein
MEDPLREAALPITPRATATSSEGPRTESATLIATSPGPMQHATSWTRDAASTIQSLWNWITDRVTLQTGSLNHVLWGAVALALLIVGAIAYLHDLPEPYVATEFVGSLAREAVELDADPVTQKELLEQRVAIYRAKVDDLGSNLQFQVAFIVLALMLLIHRSQTMTIPVLGLEVSVAWLHVIVPLGLLYLWLRFGFLLDGCIKSRLIAFHLFPSDVRLHPEHRTSPLSLLNDDGLVDGWFLLWTRNSASHAQYDSVVFPATGFVGPVMVIFYGGFLALSHACTIVLADVGRRRYGVASGCPKWLGFVTSFCLGILIASHFVFTYGGHHREWMSFVIAGATAVFTFALIRLAARVDGIAKPRPGDTVPSLWC